MHTIEVTVRNELATKKGKGYRLKVSVLDLGLYIDGFRAIPSNKNQSGWWVQPPSNNVGGKWINAVEFDKTKVLWNEIEKSCERAIETYLNEDVEHARSNSRDVLPSDEEMDDAIQNGVIFPDDWGKSGPTQPPRRYHE